ncbi:MFS transporter [Leifsonia aquatica]|uniref:MFS transporter n=1 Tax=Leifsonia aquatica TaxID=144185 RepID=UPI00384F7376
MAVLTPSRRRIRPPSVLSLMGLRYIALALIARLPFAMMVVGALTMMVELGRSVAEAGIVSAVAGIGTALGAPLLGRSIERFGQRPVLLVIGPVFGLLLVGLTALVWFGAATGVLVGVAALAGVVSPQVAPLSRSRVAAAVLDTESGPRLDAAMGYESMADEGAFVVGPVLVGALSLALGPCAPLLVAAGLTFTAVVAFALHPTAVGLAGATSGAGGRRHRLWSGRFVILVAGMSCVGAIFGATLTALTRELEVAGIPGWTGLVYGLMSVGSILSAASLAHIPQTLLPRRARWIVAASVAVAGAVVLALGPALVWTCIGLFLLGCGMGAALVTVFALTAEDVPASRRTTAFAVLSSALIVSQAVVTAGAGQLVSSAGAALGFLVAVAVGVVLLALAVTHRFVPARSVSAEAATPSNG